jgi:hypothetical protein
MVKPYDLFEELIETPAVSEPVNIVDCEIYYANRYNQDWEDNVNNKVFTTTGIQNYVERNPEYTVEEVEAEIARNRMFAKQFIKDPVQQSCYQKYAKEYINLYIANAECEGLPASGPSALYVYQGKLCYKKDLPTTATKEVKSLDFKITHQDTAGKTTTFYASHKHTRKNGGNQNNQWYDLIHFAAHATQSTEEDIIYVALADGPYYEHTTDEGLTKLEHIKKYEGDHFKAMTTTDFVQWINSLK